MALIFAAGEAPAVEYIWTGNAVIAGQDGYWWNPNNWSPIGIPTSTDSVTFAGPMSYAISSSGAPGSIRKLVLQSGAQLGQSFSMTVTDEMDLEGGIVRGVIQIANTAVMNIRGTGDRIFGDNTGAATILNSGRVVVNNDGDIVGRGQVTNDGVFEVQNDRAISGCQFYNRATFVKTGGSGVTHIAYPSNFSNYGLGLIEIRTGVVELGRSGITSSHTFFEGCGVKGPGLLRITEPSFDPNATPPPGGWLEASVLLKGLGVYPDTIVEFAHGSVLVTDGNQNSNYGGIGGLGTLRWTGGRISGASLHFSISTKFLITGDEAKRFERGSITRFDGPVTWDGTGELQMAGARLIIYDEFVAQSDAAAVLKPLSPSGFNPPGVIENHGFFRKAGGAGTTTLDQTALENYSSVTVLSGTLLFVINGTVGGLRQFDGGIAPNDALGGPARGTIACRDVNGARSTLSIEHGNLLGPGTVDANVSNSGGTVYGAWYEPGVLHILGYYMTQAEGAVQVTLAGPGPANLSQLQVDAGFSGGGKLKVWIPDSYTPNIGERFQIVTAPGNYQFAYLFNSIESERAQFDQSISRNSFDLTITNVAPVENKALLNVSTRAAVGTGDNVLIGGLIVESGFRLKPMIVRAIGPSLKGVAGIAHPLADPTIAVYDTSGTLLAQNDDWQSSADQDRIANSGLAPSFSQEAAIYREFNNGSYTVIVRGAQNTTGTALVEIYDLAPTTTGHAANLASRGHVGLGDDVMIGGFILGSPRQLLLRGIGPSLAHLNPPLPDALLDTTLSLFDSSGNLILSNDDWVNSEQRNEIQNSSLAPTSAKESAILVNLAPGSYTAVLSGPGGKTGNALIEIYDLK